MEYVGMFDMPPAEAVAMSVLQTATLFILVLAGLKLVGRRVFGEKSPQDLVILVIIAEACDLGLSDERAGYWGTVASVLTILFLGWLCERIPQLRQTIEAKPVTLYRNSRLDRAALKEYMLDESDLDEAAREYGLESYRDFKTIVLEGDGDITGIPAQGALRHGRAD